MTGGEGSLNLPDGYLPEVFLDRSPDSSRLAERRGERVVVRASEGSADAELALRMMPGAFVDFYLRLVDDGLRTGLEGKAADDGSGTAAGVGRVKSDDRWPVKSGRQSGTVARGQLQTGRSASPIKSQAAIEQRDRVDRKLRKIAREIRKWYSRGASSSRRRCQGRCKRLGDGDWNYCPNCAGPMGEVT